MTSWRVSRSILTALSRNRGGSSVSFVDDEVYCLGGQSYDTALPVRMGSSEKLWSAVGSHRGLLSSNRYSPNTSHMP